MVKDLLQDIIKSRRSVRKYLDRDVEDWKIEKILEAGRWAPSAGNVQPWRFFVIKREDIKKKIYEACFYQRHVLEAKVLIVVCVNLREEYLAYGERGVKLYCIQDSAAAIQNMLLMIHYLGLGGCWIGAFDENKVREILKLEKDLRPVAVITIGYPAESPKSWRKDLKNIVKWIE